MSSPIVPQPPAMAMRFLAWFCPAVLYEGIEGDLYEAYAYDYREHGAAIARRRYVWGVLCFFRPAIIFRNKFSLSFIPLDMIKNYILVAWRNMVRNKSYAVINIAGLALGLAIFIVVYWVARFEYSFDTFHSKAPRMYQVFSIDKFGGVMSHVPSGVINTLRDKISGVETAVRMHLWNPNAIQVGNQNLKQEHCVFADAELLTMIDVEWIAGSPEKALLPLHAVVLNESTAKRLFNGDAMGKTIRFDNRYDMLVTGVIKDMPINSEFQLDMIVSYKTLQKYEQWLADEDYWAGGDSGGHGYILLNEGADPEAVARQLAQAAEAHKDRTEYRTFRLVPFSEMHFDLDNDSANYVTPPWLPKGLLFLGAFVLLIASINFINLATVQAVQRSREIAVRKIMGGTKGSLVVQFLWEAGVITFFAIIVGAGAATVLVRHVDFMLNSSVVDAVVWDGRALVFLVVLGVGLTLVSGFYPALVLSGFEPVKVLKNKFATVSGGKVSLRKGLVVFQFAIAQVMVIGMLFGTHLMSQFYESDLGFNKSAVVTVAIPAQSNMTKLERFRTELRRHGEIADVSFALVSPSSLRSWWWGLINNPNLANGEQTFRTQYVDPEYFKFYDIKVIAGRDFYPSDSSKNAKVALINERACRELGMDANKALGQVLTHAGTSYTVIGVVKDYYANSLKNPMIPHMYTFNPEYFQQASIRIVPHQTKKAIATIEKYWKQEYPFNYFEYSFLSDDLLGFYQVESKFSHALNLFTIVGIFIGCLGLYGLISFVCVRRTKEIGIRKVLGASLANVFALLSREFVVLIVVAFCIALPVAWFGIDNVLSRYENRVGVGWWIYLCGGLLTLVIASVPILWEVSKAGLVNPADSLKHE